MPAAARAVAIALLIALVVPAAHAKPKAGEPPKPPKKKESVVVGILVKVEENKLVLETHGKNAGEATVVTDKNTKFELEDAAATLADLKPGVQIVATPATGVAQKVVATKIDKDKGKKKKKDKDKKGGAKL
jgi:hypothetical protein